jgi:hypothetical protein
MMPMITEVAVISAVIFSAGIYGLKDS